ncbi:MAG: hypothetical protein OER56_09455 [Hyphomicrobiales bacterium]|nr:hypothetical protein [Hyphomicrobiales bacterium]
MVRKFTIAIVSINLLFWLAASPEGAGAVKDQSRIGEEGKLPPSPTSPFSPHGDPEDTPGHHQDKPDPAVPFEVLEPEDIPVVVSVELTIDLAKRALDALAEVRDKYNDQGIDEYETLEEFVRETEAGKRLEKDIRRFGFKDITDWNTSISSVGFAYGAATDNEEDDIRQQISEIQIDSQIDAETKQKMISSLEAMIASDNNKSIIRQLMQDEYYLARLKLLDETE